MSCQNGGYSMQKQLSEQFMIQFFDVALKEDFPVSFFNYTQKNKSLKRLHYHNSFEIGTCLEGSGMFFIENKAISFRSGDISFIFPNQPHIAQSPNELPSKWVFIDADLNGLFADNNFLLNKVWEYRQQIPHIVHQEQCASLAPIARMIVEELEQQGHDYRLVVRELLSVLIYKISRLSQNRDSHVPAMSNAFMSITPALAYIAQNYPKEISVRTLANTCNLSETHFRVLFKKAIGNSPQQHLAYIRMKMAKALLKSTDSPVLTISQNVGYESISSFNRTFKALFGQTPSEYRSINQHETSK